MLDRHLCRAEEAYPTGFLCNMLDELSGERVPASTVHLVLKWIRAGERGLFMNVDVAPKLVNLFGMHPLCLLV